MPGSDCGFLYSGIFRPCGDVHPGLGSPAGALLAGWGDCPSGGAPLRRCLKYREPALGHIRRERMDGSAEGARPQELPRRVHHGCPPPRVRIPNRLACNGRLEEIEAKAPAGIHAGARSGTRLGCGLVSTLLFLQGLSNYRECFGNFVAEFRKLDGQQRPLGINDNVRVQPRRNSL